MSSIETTPRKDAMDLIAKSIAKSNAIELDELDHLCDRINKDFEYVTVPASIVKRTWKLFFKEIKKGDKLVNAKIFEVNKKRQINFYVGDLLLILKIKDKKIPDIEATKKKIDDETFQQMMMACPDHMDSVKRNGNRNKEIIDDMVAEFGQVVYPSYVNTSDLLDGNFYYKGEYVNGLTKFVYKDIKIFQLYFETDRAVPMTFSNYDELYDKLIQIIAEYTKNFKVKVFNTPNIREEILIQLWNAVAPKP